MVKIGPLEMGENLGEMVAGVGQVIQALDRPIISQTIVTTKTNKKGKTTTKTIKMEITEGEVVAGIGIYLLWQWWVTQKAQLEGVKPGQVIAPAFGVIGVIGEWLSRHPIHTGITIPEWLQPYVPPAKADTTKAKTEGYAEWFKKVQEYKAAQGQ